MSLILVTGANGQVGSELRYLADRHPAFTFRFTDRQSLDITDAAAVSAYFATYRPAYCINTAAYTAVDRAEEEVAAAVQLNLEGPKHLATAAAANDCRLLHLSTDYVYHGTDNIPLQETAAVNPQSLYAKTKLDGDRIVKVILPYQSIIVRTSWVYGSFGPNFVKTMVRLGRERDTLNVVYDQIGTPTYARDLAETLLRIIARTETDAGSLRHWGQIYHYSNAGVTSWYDFAQAIFYHCNIDCRVHAIRSSAYPTPAARPPFSVLDKQKIQSAFDLEIDWWQTALRRYFADEELAKTDA